MRLRVELVPAAERTLSDVVLVVDVLRATTTATVLLEQGLRTLVLAESLTSAQTLQRKGELLCARLDVAERVPRLRGKRGAGLDFG